MIRFTGAPSDSLTVLGAWPRTRRASRAITFADGVTWIKDSLVRLLGNRAPVALDERFYSVRTGDEIVLKAADLLRNDFDADGDRLRIVAVETAANRPRPDRRAGRPALPGARRLLRPDLARLHGRGRAQRFCHRLGRPPGAADRDGAAGYRLCRGGGFLPRHPGRAPARQRPRRRPHGSRPGLRRDERRGGAGGATAPSPSRPRPT